MAMELHLVGGFLGSGKTTAIITLSRALIAQGKKVGVVTNDQGKYLVDSSFMRANSIPSVEVTNGCFCCNYDRLEDKLAELKSSEHPDVVFAESVGSCGDIVATVIKPLQELSGSDTPPTSFSVFADSQLLLAYLQGEELPFSENVLYIFEKQLEEAQILVLNKIDLLTQPEADEVLHLVARAFPEKTIHTQDSKSMQSVMDWYGLLNDHPVLADLRAIEMDYERYGQGESELAWFDQELEIQSSSGNVLCVINDLIQRIINTLGTMHATIGHLKFIVATNSGELEIGITTIEQRGWNSGLHESNEDHASVLINARVQIAPDRLKTVISDGIAEISREPGVTIQAAQADSFKPGFPKPTHRMN
jgi:G3E family GTPase